jgi:hypothetical protein
VLLLRKVPQQKILRKRNLPTRQLLGQIQQEAPLQHRKNIRQLFAIVADLAVTSRGRHGLFVVAGLLNGLDHKSTLEAVNLFPTLSIPSHNPHSS